MAKVVSCIRIEPTEDDKFILRVETQEEEKPRKGAVCCPTSYDSKNYVAVSVDEIAERLVKLFGKKRAGPAPGYPSGL